MFNFKYMNWRLELMQLVLLYFLLYFSLNSLARAANLNIQNASNKSKPDQFTLDTIQINGIGIWQTIELFLKLPTMESVEKWLQI